MIRPPPIKAVRTICPRLIRAKKQSVQFVFRTICLQTGNINTKQIQILNGVKMGTNRLPKVYTATLFFLLLLNLIQNLNETKSSSYLSRQHLYSAHKIHDQTPQNCLTMLLNFSSNLLLSIDFKSWFPFDRSTLSN